MSFEPNYEKVVSNYKRKIGEMQSQIECRLPITDSQDITKVLCANVRVNTPSGQVNQNAINFDGVAMVQVVYSTIDNSPKSIDYTLEYRDKFIMGGEENVVDTIIYADVIDVRAVVENGSIKVVAIMNICIDGIFADSLNVLVSSSGEGVYTKYEDIKYTSLVGVASEKFDITSDMEIMDVVDCVLNVCPKSYIDKVEANDNYIKVYGNLAVSITYLTAGERATIRTYDSIVDFTQELALSGTTDTSVVNSLMSCMYQNIGVTTNLGMDKTVVNLVVPIDYIGYVWNEKSVQIVSDIYSTTNEINVTSNNYTIQHNYNPLAFVEKINGSVSIEENDLLIDEVLGSCCSNVVIANVRADGNNLVVDGVASTIVLYRNNEANKIVSYDVQLPFSVDLRVADINKDSNINVLSELIRVQVKARRGTELEVSGDLVLYVNISSNNNDRIISSVSLLEEKQPLDHNLIIYISKEGDTVWDIAKEMSVSEEIILEQNPKLSIPIVAGSRVVVYRQKCAQI